MKTEGNVARSSLDSLKHIDSTLMVFPLKIIINV